MNVIAQTNSAKVLNFLCLSSGILSQSASVGWELWERNGQIYHHDESTLLKGVQEGGATLSDRMFQEAPKYPYSPIKVIPKGRDLLFFFLNPLMWFLSKSQAQLRPQEGKSTARLPGGCWLITSGRLRCPGLTCHHFYNHPPTRQTKTFLWHRLYDTGQTSRRQTVNYCLGFH